MKHFLLSAVLLTLACGSPSRPDPTPTATPTPVPTPTATPKPTASCPPLSVWGSKVFHAVDANFQTSNNPDGSPRPVVGGVVTIDSTPQFVGPEGERCNVEHDSCGAARCEDPRGPDWSGIEKPAGVSANPDAFQLHFGNGCKTCRLKPGRYRWRACPRGDIHGADGQPVPVLGDACSGGSFTVEQ